MKLEEIDSREEEIESRAKEINSRIELIQDKLSTLSETAQTPGIINIQQDLLRQLNDLSFHAEILKHHSQAGNDDGVVISTI